MHYLYEPGSFVPVAQALRKRPIVLHRQPDWSQREYDFDDDPLWQTEMKPQAFDAIAWYHCDHLGTPMELTDEQGNIASGQYKAWGEVREDRSGWAKRHTLSNPIRFQGQYHDCETGLHYNRYRYYETIIGRYISKDPISYAGGLNLFAYAPNAIARTDPLGLARQPKAGRYHGPKPKYEKPGHHDPSSAKNSAEAAARPLYSLKMPKSFIKKQYPTKRAHTGMPWITTESYTDSETATMGKLTGMGTRSNSED